MVHVNLCRFQERSTRSAHSRSALGRHALLLAVAGKPNRLRRNRITAIHTPKKRLLGNFYQSPVTDGKYESREESESMEVDEGLRAEYSSEDDIVIALLGPTGSGRSTFIRSVTGSEAPLISDKLGSCTAEIVPIRYQDRESGQSVVFLDTPGFNNTFQCDHNLDILNSLRISHWLESRYGAEKHLSRVLYFHRVTDNRTPGTLLLYLRMFRRLLGESFIGSIHLVTTMWDLVETSVGEERFQELREGDWKAVIDQGARMSSCGSDDDSAKAILREIIDDVKSRKDEIVIAVMGATGSGKSTVIRSASGSETHPVSDALRCQSTDEVVAVRYKEQQNGKCVVLLDTPGFGNSGPKSMTERNVLKMVSEWLNANSSAKSLSGILYLHRITDNRVTGTTFKLGSHPALLRRLLGSGTLDKVYLTTTMWDEVERGVGESRLAELRTNYWKGMIEQGAKTARCEPESNHNTPKDILSRILCGECAADTSVGNW